MNIDVSLGHRIDATLSFLDQFGNPMLITPTPDSPPVWDNSNKAVETLVATADGLGAAITPTAVGTDSVTANILVGGKTFSATLNVNVTPVVQVLTSVDVIPVVA